MIGVGGSDWKHYARRRPHVVKRRIRKGIPDCLRGVVWQLISGSRDLLLMNPGVYEVELFLFLRPIQYHISSLGKTSWSFKYLFVQLFRMLHNCIIVILSFLLTALFLQFSFVPVENLDLNAYTRVAWLCYFLILSSISLQYLL
ncbi:TBC1 domain family member 10B [Linum perenne]